MGNLSNRSIHEVFGCPTEDETVVVEFSDSASAALTLEANTTYRLAATEDVYINFGDNPSTAVVTADGVLVFGGVPEVFCTTGKNIYLTALRVDTDGDLHVTKMITRGN